MMERTRAQLKYYKTHRSGWFKCRRFGSRVSGGNGLWRIGSESDAAVHLIVIAFVRPSDSAPTPYQGVVCFQRHSGSMVQGQVPPISGSRLHFGGPNRIREQRSAPHRPAPPKCQGLV